MDEHTILGQLEELAQSLSIKVRYEPIRREGSFYTGGLCLLKGEYLLIINNKATIRDKIEALARSMKRFDLDHVYVRPGLREFLKNLPD